MAGKKYYKYDEEDSKGYSVKEVLKQVKAWDAFKGAVGLVAGGCAAAVMNRYLKGALPEETSTFGKVVTAVGVYFVTGFVGSTVDKHVRNEMDDIWKSVHEADEAIRKAKEEANG